MQESVFEKQLNELVQEIQSVPAEQREKLAELVRKAGESNKRLRKSVNNLQESLDYVRVCVKYLLFDLEATRRENADLRTLLENDK